MIAGEQQDTGTDVMNFHRITSQGVQMLLSIFICCYICVNNKQELFRDRFQKQSKYLCRSELYKVHFKVVLVVLPSYHAFMVNVLGCWMSAHLNMQIKALLIAVPTNHALAFKIASSFFHT